VVFSPFTIPSREEHERDVRSGKTQILYDDLVALMQDIDAAEEELLSAVAGGHEYTRLLEADRCEHPKPDQIEPETLRQLYLAMEEPLPDWSPIKGRRGRVKERYPTRQWRQQLEQWRATTEWICRATLAHEQFLRHSREESPSAAAPL
jgi:hypothetical protein